MTLTPPISLVPPLSAPASTVAALDVLSERIRAAADSGRRLAIRGHASKAFYGEPVLTGDIEWLDTAALAGISSYEPSELVITARAGTPLAEVEAALARRGQCLAFEPPRFAGPGGLGTIGGVVACGLAGPARMAAGGVRDAMLGATVINGRGECLSFGGQVMKNVAGYDVSRLLAGSLGTLGLIAEVSLKVLPQPPATATLRFEWPQAQALAQLHRWAGQALPINASAWWDDTLALRLAGAQAAVQAACVVLGGERVHPHAAAAFWDELRDHTDAFFTEAHRAALDPASGLRLWRLALPPTTPVLDLAGDSLIEWGGAQRWLISGVGAAEVRASAHAAGGHATIFVAADKSPGVFSPRDPAVAAIEARLRLAFDPHRVFASSPARQ